MDEGTFAEWLIPAGGQVKKGDMLFVLEGDKAAQEIESFDEGTLHLIATSPRPGEVVKVGQVLALLLAPGESGEQVQSGPKTDRSQESRLTDPPAGPASRRLARELRVDLETVEGTGVGGRITPEDVERASQRSSVTSTSASTSTRPSSHDLTATDQKRATPRARRRAASTGIDWRTLTGTGRNGRIREVDVIKAQSSGNNSAAKARSTADQVMAFTSNRRTIARRMLESHLEKASVTLNTTADMTNLVSLREQFRQLATADLASAVPSYNDFLVKLCAHALREHPQLNAAWDESGIRIYGNINIGIAVDTDQGLLVPVVRDVDRKSLRKIAVESTEVIARARKGRLAAADVQEGTFTITNLGALGIDTFTPVINGPQCAILGVGRIRKEPVWTDGQFVPRDIISLSLTFDHRIVDGAPAARFLKSLVQALESPAAILID